MKASAATGDENLGEGTPKYPGVADASHYAIAERDKSTAKREEKSSPWAAEVDPHRAAGTICPAEATVPP